MNASSGPPGTDDLFTVSAGGFSATVDAFARDDRAQTLWFLSMVGSQTALKAIWAALLKQPPEPAHLIRGADGTALSGGYHRCVIPPQTVGTWTTKIVRLSATGGYHAHRVFEVGRVLRHDSDSFLLLAGHEREAPCPAPQVPRPPKPSTPPPLLGQLAVEQGHRHRRDSTAAVGRHHGVPAASPTASGSGSDLSEAVASGAVTLTEAAGGGPHG